MEQWNPDVQQLGQVVSFLIALRDPTRPDHMAAVNTLTAYSDNADFILNLVHLFVKGSQYESLGLQPDVRQMAGYVMKNYVCPKLSNCPENVRQFVKLSLMEALADPVSDIQYTAANAFGSLTKALPIEQWGDVIPPLIERLSPAAAERPEQLAGFMRAVLFVSEDSGDSLCLVEQGQFLDALLPRLVHLLPACRTNASVVADALHCCCALVEILPTVDADEILAYQRGSINLNDYKDSLYPATLKLNTHLPSLLKTIADLAQHEQASVRGAVYRCLQLLSLTVGSAPAFVESLSSIRQFMVSALLDPDSTAAIQACDFWFTVVEGASLADASLIQHLPQLIPALIARMCLSDEQREQERADAEAKATGEKQLPFFFSDKNDEDNDDEASSAWTIRQQAALLLDTISRTFPTQLVLSPALPSIEQLFLSTDVWAIESGMLALGAVSEKCASGLSEILPQVHKLCIQGSQHEVPELRAASCWLLSRCCNSILDSDNESSVEQFRTSLAAVTACMMDRQPQVQAKACSALRHFVESAGEDIIPYLGPIMSIFPTCASFYGVNCTVLLFDLVATIAASVGEALDDATLTPFYLPILISRLRVLEDSNTILIPLLDCLGDVCIAARSQVVPYAAEISCRCLRIIGDTLNAQAKVEERLEDDAPSKDFASCGLYVLTGLSEGLGEHFVELMSGQVDNLVTVLLTCATDVLPGLRLYALGLCGQITRSSPALLTQEMRLRIVQVILPQLVCDDPDLVPSTVCSNAIWTIGNMAVSYGGSDLTPFVGTILEALCRLLFGKGTPESVYQNIGVTMGALGCTHPAQVTIALKESFVPFCGCLQLVDDPDERARAFQGLVAVLSADPSLVLGGTGGLERSGHAFNFIRAVASWEDPPPEPLLSQLSAILKSLMQTIGPQNWRSMLNKFEANSDVQNHLFDMFRLAG